MALAVVHEQRVRPADRGENEIGVAVAVDVRERASGGMAVWNRDARGDGDILEPPVAQVTVQRARALGAREKDVDSTIAIDVGEAHTAALCENAIEQEQRVAERVVEPNAGARGIEQREPRTPPDVAG